MFIAARKAGALEHRDRLRIELCHDLIRPVKGGIGDELGAYDSIAQFTDTLSSDA